MPLLAILQNAMWIMVGVGAVIFVSAYVATVIQRRRKKYKLEEEDKETLRTIYREKYRETALTEITKLQQEKAEKNAKQDAHDMVYGKPKFGTGMMKTLKNMNAELEKSGNINTNFLNDVVGIPQSNRPARDPNPPKNQRPPKKKTQYTTWTDDLEKEFSN